MTQSIQQAINQLKKLNEVLEQDVTKGTAFEREFIQNNAGKATQFGDKFGLSPKQLTILQQIFDKHGG